MLDKKLYIIDSDVFITAKNTYYAFAICPGFWSSILRRHKDERLYSIGSVKKELLKGQEGEDLVSWVKDEVPEEFFLGVENKVAEKYEKIIF